MVQPDPFTLTAICDPSPGILAPGTGDTVFPCTDAISKGYRALSALVGRPARMRLAYPACPSAPCDRQALITATITGWIDANPWTVVLRVDENGVVMATVPSPAAGASWPVETDAIPAITRPVIDGAPKQVARRDAYPFCGGVEVGAWAAYLAGWHCFAAAVYAGRPAELLVDAVSGEGVPIIELLRFSGTGALIAYTGSGGHWVVSSGSLMLPATDTLEPAFAPWGDVRSIS